jgi:uncharacterized protein YukE
MTAAVGLKPLAPFSHNWVGGNIDGLAALAGTLYGYAPKMDAVADALDGQVRQLVNATGWEGEAASAFTASWSKDSQTARALGLASDQVGGIVDWLAAGLSMLEAELEAAATAAAAHGVTIGPDGMPPEVCFGPPANAKEEEMQEWANWYQTFYADIMGQAQQARSSAAGALADTGRQIVAPRTSGTKSTGGGSKGMNAGDDLTVGDLLGDLMAAPAAASRAAAAKLASARSSLGSAKQAILKLRQKLGEDTVIPDDMLADIKSSLDSVVSDSRALQAAQKINTKVFEALDLRVKNVTTYVNEQLAQLRKSGEEKTSDNSADGDSGAADGADDGADGVLAKLADFGKDIPVLDVLAAAGGTYLGVKGATADGQSLDVALPEQTGANVASLAAGAFVGGSVSGALAGTSVVSGLTVGGLAVGGAVAAAGGVLVGGVVAVGVGDFATHLFQENWGGDIHNYGVVDGVLYGIGHSEIETGEDFAHMGEDIGHTVAKVWDSIF